MMMNKLLVEFIGTFLFLSVILVSGQPLPVAISLAAVLYFGAKTSGGHFNPAVSTMFLAKGDINFNTFLGYVVVQVLGGLAALQFKTNVLV
jgi:aquaporin Z|tara:strand:+ start:4578 stop:4850 length:273 start_codon:yes stop_codon:yes gene_type:complete